MTHGHIRPRPWVQIANSDGCMVTMLSTPGTTADHHAGLSVRHLGPRFIALDPSVTPDAWVCSLSRPTVTHDLAPIRRSHTMSINSPFMTSQKFQKGSRAPVGFINLGSPMGPLPSRSSAQQTALQQRAAPGPAQIPNDRLEEQSSLRPEGLAKEGTTLASDSDPLFRPGIH